ncbi:hypothetical protein HOU00_gp237 [Caulobacter phage CcrPW]|uniref:Uncharacterized protein n=1 Tax=Caulobacter phage CcrPW TaxID=2283271 RepID=A0A385EDS1_9CAUD|nr:hypothetical protein HOU00_gp237 [Caulobacter phage CcrPW]AXQ68888.1 hypothetical protein CcrPW_gp349 [Caulobacter phage CcrPW]
MIDQITHPKQPLVDYDTLQREHGIPAVLPTDRERLDVGLLGMVKVSAEGESFWACIVALGLGFRIARVDNALQRTDLHGLSDGDHIIIRPCNIREIGTR